MIRGRARGFTLVEVLVALMIVAIGLAALMTTVNGAADASGYLRDKTLGVWIAMNRIVEVRLNLQHFGANTDKGQISYAGRDWHYDTRYFDTSIPSMRRIVVRVWAGKTAAKGNPLAEAIGFLGADLTAPGGANVDWTQGSVPTATTQPAAGAAAAPNSVAAAPPTPAATP